MTRARTNADQAHTESVESIPHIIPGVLYPAVAGKLLDGSTSHSGNYGTAQSDGRSYFYTDIKGSREIHDPRVGALFGSTRHKFKSLQLLEQETATHGSNVYSVDGREWCRMVGSPYMLNHNDGHHVYASATAVTVEITGYFNDFNFISDTHTQRMDDIDITVNGGTTREGNSTIGGRASVQSPLTGRYVDIGSVINIGSTVSTDLGTSPTINTIKLVSTNVTSEYWAMFGIELIAQDTSSTANRSKIQIPSQNVVSYGKKFTVSGTPHYDPFNGFTSGNLAAVQALIDTDTSLGMANWLSSSTYYRPFNGGRVVKWVDSSGNIKTSVTMMPPNAQNIKGTASNAIDLSSSQTNDDTINFNTSAIDHSLSETAKTFHWREFGNGSANGGTESGTNADFSMHINNDSTQDNLAYVMDDGLTSLTGLGSHTTGDPDNITSGGSAKGFYFTFIGTGITLKTTSAGAGTRTMAINLPYGTHVYRHFRDAGATPDGNISGVALADIAGDTYSAWEEVTFHQPKMPPVPPEACIIMDVMLMADYVQRTSSDESSISSGVRRIGGSRDHFYDCAGAIVAIAGGSQTYPWYWYGPGSHASNTMPVSLPYFGTSFTSYAEDQSQTHTFTLDGSAVTPTEADSDETRADLFYHAVSTLGQHTKVHTLPAGGYRFAGTDVATPIHTSSHYQTFEDPLLKTLVGGDRNIEQTNLVVTPDGKTWDEVTRDTSYIGNMSLRTNTNTAASNNAVVLFDDWRGQHRAKGSNWFNKDFAIAYDRMICLRHGHYQINWHTESSDALGPYIYINGVAIFWGRDNYAGGNYTTLSGAIAVNLDRGDTVALRGYWKNDHDKNEFHIIRLS